MKTLTLFTCIFYRKKLRARFFFILFRCFVKILFFSPKLESPIAYITLFRSYKINLPIYEACNLINEKEIMVKIKQKSCHFF